MDKDSKQTLDTTDQQADHSTLSGQTPSDASRRKFTRGALVGGAVLVSLGNRAAWGAKPNGNPVCVSKATWDSFHGGAPSISPNTVEKVEALEKELRKNDMIMQSTDESVCAVQCYSGPKDNPLQQHGISCPE